MKKMLGVLAVAAVAAVVVAAYQGKLQPIVTMVMDKMNPYREGDPDGQSDFQEFPDHA